MTNSNAFMMLTENVKRTEASASAICVNASAIVTVVKIGTGKSATGSDSGGLDNG